MKKKLLIMAYGLLSGIVFTTHVSAASLCSEKSPEYVEIKNNHELVQLCQSLSDLGLNAEHIVAKILKRDEQRAYLLLGLPGEGKGDSEDLEPSTAVCPCPVEIVAIVALLMAYGVHVLYCWE